MPTFQPPFLNVNANNGVPSNDGGPFSSPRRSVHGAFVPTAGSPQGGATPPVTLLGLDNLVSMEDLVASRLATRMALARLGATAAAHQQQQQERQQQAAALLALRQQQQQVHCVSPVKQSRDLLNQMARQHQAVKLMALQQQQQQQQQQARVTPCVSPVKQQRAPSSPGASSLPGLDLLSTASLSVASSDASQLQEPSSPKRATVSESSSPIMHASPKLNATASAKTEPNQEMDSTTTTSKEEQSSNGRFYIDAIHTNDILCGRGGRSNHHLGNKRYRQVVGNMKFMYQKCPAKTLKTDLSRAIVEHCCSYGARFVKKDDEEGKYYVLTKAEARKKTSQALRETKALKWTTA